MCYNRAIGELSPGEKKVFLKLQQKGHDYWDDERNCFNYFEIDSLVDSAYDSEKNAQWAKCQESVGAPRGSFASEEDIIIFDSDDSLMNMRSSIEEESSSISSDSIRTLPSFVQVDIDGSEAVVEDDEECEDSCDCEEHDEHKDEEDKMVADDSDSASSVVKLFKRSTIRNKKQYLQSLQKYCFFKTIDGLRVPQPIGMDGGRRFTLNDLIDISGLLMAR